MLVKPTLENLRQRISCLEEGQRRFSRTIPVADAVDRWLPHGGLPAGCIHEVKASSLANAIAFASILSSQLAGEQGHILYITPGRSLYPLGLLPYGVRLDQVLHISTRRSQDLAWAVMEALRCPQVSAAIALLDGLDLTECRRLQLAAEDSGVTGFLLGHTTSTPIASPITRWQVSAVPGNLRQRFDETSWALNLLYCRGGRPGAWTAEWRDQKLSAIPVQPAKPVECKALAG